MHRSFFPLQLGVSPSSLTRRRHPDAASEEEFARMREKALRRDTYVCQGCGLLFEAYDGAPGGGLDVHHINANPRDNRIENLVSLCPLCHGTQHLGFFARRFGNMMQLIFCPEISQNSLNMLSWVSAIVFYRSQNLQSCDSVFRDKANLLTSTLTKRQEFPKNYFASASVMKNFLDMQRDKNGPVASLATILATIRQKEAWAYEVREKWLWGVRIFYNPLLYEQFLDRKNKNLVAHLATKQEWQPGEDWEKSFICIARDVLARVEKKQSMGESKKKGGLS